MKLIDMDKLKFPNIAIFDMKLHGAIVPMVRLLDLQKLVPAVDAVQVVRCKDCKYCYFADNRVLSEQTWVCDKNGLEKGHDWYCADGKRRDDDADGKTR